MATRILPTKLYVPHPRIRLIHRPRLFERLDEGLHQPASVTLISAPVGFGKSTLVAEWAVNRHLPSAWLSLDSGDNDPVRFLTYIVAALQTIDNTIGKETMEALSVTPFQFSLIESSLITLLDDIDSIRNDIVLVFDDYHIIESKINDTALAFLIQHLPANLHFMILTREDPNIPLARLRIQNRLVELRAADLKFTLAETIEFLNNVMRLNLSHEDVTALESRTEGWIAGLQLAAISIQGNIGNKDFIKSFTGSHRFVMDYLIEEVLQQQPENIQEFLLKTSILDRFCSSLCDTILQDENISSQEMLEYLESSNLFLIPLDDEGRWYRYHHLFTEFLRQQLRTNSISTQENFITELHIRASQWYEDNGFDLEAFNHAGAGNDIERAVRLIEGKGIPLYYRGAVITILNWLESLPRTILDAKPYLWWKYASLLLINGQTTGVEEKLRAAETTLHNAEPDGKTRNLIGQIALSRATLALTRYDGEEMLAQSRRSLEYLSSNNLYARATASWTLGYAHILSGDRAEARQAFIDAISLSQTSGDTFTTILSMIGLGNVQELDNQLYLAAETYQESLKLAGDHPIQVMYEAYLGLARIHYEWNDLDTAEQYGKQSLQLARQYEGVIDRFIVCEIFLARLRLAERDVTGANAILSQTHQSAVQRQFLHRLPEIAAMQAQALIQQGDLNAASRLAEKHNLPLIQARITLIQNNSSAGLALLEPIRVQMEAKDWKSEQLKVKALEAVLYQANGEMVKARDLLIDALSAAELGGGIRTFLDEGMPMYQLLTKVHNQGLGSNYLVSLLTAFEATARDETEKPRRSSDLYIEDLSQRELDVLRLIAQGLTNQEISERLFLALDTVKNHNRRIFSKLQVQRRTEAIARARELGLI